MSKITTGQIGELINQSNSGKISREMLQAFLNCELVVPHLNVEGEVIILHLGDRTYEALTPLKPGEISICDCTMVQRSKEMRAYLGEEEARYLMKHQAGIPVVLQGRISFIFRGWCKPDHAAEVYHDGAEWVMTWARIDGSYGDGVRLVRLIK